MSTADVLPSPADDDPNPQLIWYDEDVSSFVEVVTLEREPSYCLPN